MARISIGVTSDTLAVASTDHVDCMSVLIGPGLRAVIAERLSQVSDHGYTLHRDLGYQEAELAFAAKSYLDTYIDLELGRELDAETAPESWPFANLYWKEPRHADRARALTKAIALAWAELDRLIAAEDILRAARPLFEEAE